MTVTTPTAPGRIKVAIIGAGPAGLGAAIALNKHGFVDWQVYEKKPEVSEIGNGISLQQNTWRMLERLGAAGNLTAEQLFRPASAKSVQHRNGQTGALIYEDDKNITLPSQIQHARVFRARLQQALLKEVEKDRVHVDHKIIGLTQLDSGRVRIEFDGGKVDEVDIVVGADGLRSVVRTAAFPNHHIAYTGATCYRAVVKWSEAEKVDGLLREVTFWHGTDKKWVYTCPLEGDNLEITCAIKEAGGEERSSWGKPASVTHFQNIYSELCQTVRQVLGLVDAVDQYDYFAGPRLKSLISHGNIVLIGDASHPLSGAFGAGAGFALEDAYTLGEAIGWAAARGRPYADALTVFDELRSPHYKALYDILDAYSDNEVKIARQNPTPEDEIRMRIKYNWNYSTSWFLAYDAAEVWKSHVATVDEKIRRSKNEPLAAPHSQLADEGFARRVEPLLV